MKKNKLFLSIFVIILTISACNTNTEPVENFNSGAVLSPEALEQNTAEPTSGEETIDDLISPYTPVFPDDSETWMLVGQVGGVTKALYMEDDILYVGMGLKVIILDVAEPDNIQVLGESPILPQYVESITSNGKGLLFISCGSGGLVILNVNNPASPGILSILDTHGYTESAALYGEYVLLADGPQGVQIVDYSNVYEPKTVSEAYPLAYVYDIVIQDDIAYAAGGGSGLFVVDISNPETPVETGLTLLDGFQYDAEIVNGNLYLAGAWGGVSMFSLENPSQPMLESTTQTDGWAMALAGAENNLIVMDGANGIKILSTDLNSPPVLVSELVYDGYIITGDADENTVFVLDEEKGMITIDYSVQSNPKPISRWIPLLYGRKVDVSDGFCYVAGGLSGMHVYDLKDVDIPLETYWYDTGTGFANEVYVHDDKTYLAMRLLADFPIMEFDVSDPYAIEQTKLLDNSRAIYQTKGGPIMMAGDIIYMTGGCPMSIDLSDPKAIVVKDCIDDIETGSGDVMGNLFVARNNSDLHIIDCSDPDNLQIITTINVDSSGAAVRFISDTLFIAATTDGFDIYELTNPANPKKVSEMKMEGDISDIFIDGTTAYMSAQGAGVHIVDLTDPMNPIYIDTISTYSCAWDCYVKDDVMYVADASAGLTIYMRGDTLIETLTNGQEKEGKESALITGPVNSESFEETVYPLPMQKPDTAPNIYLVTSAEDIGIGTLRYGLASNRLKDNTIITFDTSVFSPSSPATIELGSELPYIDNNFITIDASNAGVILDGNNEVRNGLELCGKYITIMGLQLTGFTEYAIVDGGAYTQIGGNRNIGDGPIGQGNCIGNCYLAIKVNGYKSVVQGNLVGLDVTGTKAAPNWCGIFVTEGDYVTVGGAEPGLGNVVSASERGNITSWSDNVVVIGNIVGLDITGTKAIWPNTEFGVFFELDAVNNVLGGNTPEERNIISGVQTGVIFGDQKTYQCTAIGNYIGTDITGTKAVPNNIGYFSYVSYHNRIGGTAEGEENVISGNSKTGVDALNDTIVIGNIIGYTADCKEPLPNDIAVILRSYVTIGGYTPNEGNLIYGGSFGAINDGEGVTGSYIAGNAFESPSSSGIWLNSAYDMFIQNNTFAQTSNFTILIDGGAANNIRSNTYQSQKISDVISLVQNGNIELSAPLVNEAADNIISGTAGAYNRVEVYVYENGYVSPIGYTVAAEDGNFTFVNAESLAGKQVLLIAMDLLNNTSAFSQLYFVE